MTTALLVITDGRGDYLVHTLESAYKNLHADFGYQILVNDSGDPGYKAWLEAQYPEFRQIHHPTRRGLAAAVRSGWEAVLETNAQFCFHLEDDWTFNEPVDVALLQGLLERQPHLANVVLLRQYEPNNPLEAAARSVFGGHEAEYDDSSDGTASWVEHRLYFSLNPCLIPRAVLELGWSDDNEAGFTYTCTQAGYRFAFWGTKADAPRSHHIGTVRTDAWAL